MWKSALLEKEKKPQPKNFKLIFFGTIEKNQKVAHDTIQWLNRVLRYLNMKIKGTGVEIIDLKYCSSLKWDGVDKKGTSWAGTCLL